MLRTLPRCVFALFCAVLVSAAACSSTTEPGDPQAAAGSSATPTAGASSNSGGASSTAGVPATMGGKPSACTTCGDKCVETQSDPANCGSCGVACPANQVCSKGACGKGCAAGLTKCGAACVDTTGSQANCGGCEQACPSDQTCWQSACICPDGQDACGDNGACIDVLESETNCGKCGAPCAMGATCTTGACVCPGAAGIVCNGACVDSAVDKNNCGACGKVCGAGTSCLSGVCLDPATVTCNGSQQNNTCSKGANITLGPYWVNNNWWGDSNGDGQTCVWSNCSTGDLAGWGQSFEWTGDEIAVKTYAALIFGWQWGWKTGNGGQRLVTSLPLQLNSNRAVNCGWSFKVTPTGTPTLNVAYDLFAHTVSNPGSSDDPTDEIMIWLHRGNNAAPIGKKQPGTFSTGGHTFDFYHGDNARWKVHSYLRQTNADTAVLNMMDFIRDLVSRGLIANTKYLSSVQAGAEIFSGQGQVQTNGFYCRVQ